MNYTSEDIAMAKQLKEDGYNWVARDIRDNLYAYVKRPLPTIIGWACADDCLLPTKMFSNISREDVEPTNLDDIIASESKPNYERLTTGFFECSRCKNGICEIPNSLCKDRLCCERHNRLYEIENKIENGELVFKEDKQ